VKKEKEIVDRFLKAGELTNLTFRPVWPRDSSVFLGTFYIVGVVGSCTMGGL
jgi:hypothetical protein